MRQASGYGGVFKFLASDRVSALLVELASHGVGDFKHANVLDRKWNLRLKWLAQSYSSNKSAEVVKLAILRYTGALGYGTADLFNQAWESMDQLFDSYDKAARPWIDKEKSE